MSTVQVDVLMGEVTKMYVGRLYLPKSIKFYISF